MQPSRLGLTLTSGKAIHWCNAPASDLNGDLSSSLLPYLQPSVYLTTLLLSRGHLFLGAPLHMPPSQTLCGLHGIWELAITIFIFDMRELVSRDLQGPELITA